MKAEHAFFALSTHFSWKQVIEMKGMPSLMRDTENREIFQTLIVTLFKLWSGNSNNIIAVLLDIAQPQRISDYFNSVLTAFDKDVFCSKFGLAAYSLIFLNNCGSNLSSTL